MLAAASKDVHDVARLSQCISSCYLLSSCFVREGDNVLHLCLLVLPTVARALVSTKEDVVPKGAA
jgi:hypothetical protein